MEQYKEAPASRWRTAIGMVVLVYGSVAFSQFDPGWIFEFWWGFPTLLVAGALGLLAGRRNHVIAGADWVAREGDFVNTYSLTMIKASPARSWDADLDLEDNEGHKLRIRLSLLQENQRLWNLVYNGMAHSVAYGDTELKGLNYDKFLRLDRFRGRPSTDPWSYWHDPWPPYTSGEGSKSQES